MARHPHDPWRRVRWCADRARPCPDRRALRSGRGPDRLSVRLGGERRPWRGAIFPASYREISSPLTPKDPSASGTLDDLAVILLRNARDRHPAACASRSRLPWRARRRSPSATAGPARSAEVRRRRSAPRRSSAATAPRPTAHASFTRTSHLCTLDSTARSQACAGDSGSPVMVHRNGAWAVAGVVTWGGETYGHDCGEGLRRRLGTCRRASLALDRDSRRVPRTQSARVRVRRSGKVRRCVIGRWHPAARASRCAGGARPVRSLRGGTWRVAGRRGGWTRGGSGARSRPVPRAGGRSRSPTTSSRSAVGAGGPRGCRALGVGASGAHRPCFGIRV